VLGTAVVLAAALLGRALFGPARPVRVEEPRPPEPVAAACARLVSDLPDELDGHPRRRVEPGSDRTAAWGDPPIVLRCGVPVPAAYGPTAQLYTINGVDWFAEELTAGYVFTTVGRRANVEVTVPDEHAPEVNPVADISLVVARDVPPAPSPSPVPGAGTRPTAGVSAGPSSGPAPPR
jgi:hypothetical protein